MHRSGAVPPVPRYSIKAFMKILGFFLPILIDDSMTFEYVSRSKSVLVFALLHCRSVIAPWIRKNA
jgi:hypothetical protein